MPGKGTTFDIYIPETEFRKEAAQPRAQTPSLTGTERILFIDDEQILVNVAKEMLENLGYRVATETSSIKALDLFKQHPDQFDLVISDIVMPGMTGDKLAQELLNIRHDIPIILCTGFSENITEEKAKRTGIQEFIMKPLEADELAKTIRKVLDEV
jgi:CheY-like chemotaxis protein